MKNKKLFGILSLLLATGLVLGGCDKKPKTSSTNSSETPLSSESSMIPSSENPSSEASSEPSSEPSSESSASSEVDDRLTVVFMNGDEVFKEFKVNEGEKIPVFDDIPSKTPDENAYRYGFRGWEGGDITAPVTSNMVFTAKFAPYEEEYVIGDFEDYTANAELEDDGWYTLGYSSTGWTKNTAATVSIGQRAAYGKQSLRFDAWANSNDYKIARDFEKGQFKKAFNALKFSLMVPKITTVKVLLQGNVTVEGQIKSAYFSYKVDINSGEYVDYVIPFDDSSWALWGEAGKSMVEVADWIGVHQDDVVTCLTSIEFYFRANDGIGGQKYIAFLDDVSFVTLDDAKRSQVEAMGHYSTYTGLNNSDYTARIDVANNGDATFKIIDMEEPLTINGKVVVEEKDFTFTSNDDGASLVYKGKLINGGQQIEFVSASGTQKSHFNEVAFNAFQVVEDFESYESSGTAYYAGNLDMNNRSGVRGAFYGEYYKGSGQSEWGGTGWSLMEGEGNQIELKKDGGHTGNNYVSFKHSKDFGLRYIQWGLFDSSSELNSFRGSKFSFWAKTSGLVKSFKVSMYSQTAPRNATKDSQVKALTFTANAAIDEWKHYEIDLNPNLVYYGFLVFIEKDTTLDVSSNYLYMDDFEVYGASPYSTYVPKAELKVPVGMTYISKIKGGINTYLEIKDDSHATLSIPGLNQSVDGTYTFANPVATFTFSGVTYTATLSEDAKSLTCESVGGSDGFIKTALSGLDFNMISYVDNAESYSDDGTMYYQGNTDESLISGARGAYHCDFYSAGTSTPSPIGGSNWSLMEGDGDQVQLDTSTFVDGRQSLKFEYGSENMRYIQWNLHKGTAKAHTGFNRFGMYFKNTNDIEVTLKFFVYTVQLVDTSTQGSGYRVEKEITLPANSDWTFYTLNLTSSTSYYGYGINTVTKTEESGFIHVDNAFFFNDYDSPDYYFTAPIGLTLTGLLNGTNEATIYFGDNAGQIKFTCSELGKENVGGTYSMSMDEGVQKIRIVVSKTIIQAAYSIDENGNVTMEITAVSGSLSSGFTVGDTLTGKLS